jgi:hypothetical protein
MLREHGAYVAERACCVSEEPAVIQTVRAVLDNVIAKLTGTGILRFFLEMVYPKKGASSPKMSTTSLPVLER